MAFENDWKLVKDPIKCREKNCSSRIVKVRTWDSSDGAYTDYEYKCAKCNATWWIDGPDY